jgi:hypothetical protein
VKPSAEAYRTAIAGDLAQLERVELHLVARVCGHLLSEQQTSAPLALALLNGQERAAADALADVIFAALARCRNDLRTEAAMTKAAERKAADA